MVNTRGCEGARAEARRVTKVFSEFYALLLTLFSLRRRKSRQRRAQGYAPIHVTALTALLICVFEFKTFVVVFQLVSPRTFCPSHFLG